MPIQSVTQITNKSTAVVPALPKSVGEIVTHAASLATLATVSFTLTNPRIKATDTVVINHVSGGTLGAYSIDVNTIVDGSCKVSIFNRTAGALAEALTLRFRAVPLVG